MTREATIHALLDQGRTPGQIARHLDQPLPDVLLIVDQLIGQGRVRYADVLLNIPRESRQPITRALLNLGYLPTAEQLHRDLTDAGHTIALEDIEVMLRYGDVGRLYGEVYEHLRDIEVGLHRLIREAFVREFGEGETGWWRQGIPRDVRIKAQSRREEDDALQPSEPYGYTDLIDLRLILDRQWKVLAPYLPPKARGDRRVLLDDMLRMNQIRRVIMHPVRGGLPSENDLDFLHHMRRRLGFGETRF